MRSIGGRACPRGARVLASVGPFDEDAFEHLVLVDRPARPLSGRRDRAGRRR